MSRRNRSSRRAAISRGERVRRRAAASSMGSGWPSRRRQISVTAGRVAASSAKPGRTAAARSAKSCTASGSASASTGCSTSPGTPSGSRLVASTRRRGHAVSRVSASAATSATRCSQLSSTRIVSRPSRAASSRVSGSGTSVRPRCSSGSPTAASTAGGSCVASVSAASSATTALGAAAGVNGAGTSRRRWRRGVRPGAGRVVVGCGRPRGGGTDLGHERGLPCQPGLARPAGAGERDEARGAQERADALDVGGAPHEARQPGGAGGGERRAQHRHPGFGQLEPGVDAQLVGQQRDRAVEGGERIGLAARGVQRPAQQRRRGLAQRRGGELGGERVDVGREAQPQRQPGALVDGVGAAPVEPGRRRAREGQLDDVGQRGPAPERQRVAEEAVRLRRARRTRLGDQRVERHRVDRAGLDRQPVAARAR